MNAFYTETSQGRRIWVNTSSNRIKVWDKTCTSNPHQPAAKWFQIARPKDAAAYAAKKVAAGEWVAA